MCECGCHDNQAACSSCCLDILKEKNKLISYPNPIDVLFQRIEKLESEIKNQESMKNAFRDLTANHISQLDKEMQETQCDYQREFQATNHLIEHAETGIEKCFERIEKEHKDANDALIAIQDQFKSEMELGRLAFNNLVEINIKNLHDRIDELEEWKKAAIEKNIQDNQRIKQLEAKWGNRLAERVEKLEKHFSGDYQLIASKLNPHKCPVCNSLGFLSISYIGNGENSEINRNVCHSCQGKGIVWG